MGFGVEYPGTGYGMKADYESSETYNGGGSSMQMMRPMHNESHHAHSHGGPHGHNMHHASHSHGYGSNHNNSSGYGKPAGMHGHGHTHLGMPHSGQQSYQMHNSGPGHMSDMSYEQGSFDNGMARGYNYDGRYNMQNGGYGANCVRKGVNEAEA